MARPGIDRDAILRNAQERARCNALNAVIQEATRRAQEAGRSREYILACEDLSKFALAQMEKQT